MVASTSQPYFLQSQASLHQFLSGEREAAAILQASFVNPEAEQARIWGSPFSELNELYYIVSGLFLTIGSYFLHALCMTDLSKRVWVQSRHTTWGASVINAQRVFQSNLLAKSVNTHRLDAAHEYLHPPVNTLFSTYPSPGVLSFFHDHGICRGACHWFIYLYLKTRGHFLSVDHHLQAVCKQFENGASQQAVLLHSLQLELVYGLLRLRVDENCCNLSAGRQTDGQMIAQLQACPPGVYGIYTSTHQVVYIKVNESQRFLFDPNIGLIRLASPPLFKKAMEGYFQNHDSSQEIAVDRYTPF